MQKEILTFVEAISSSISRFSREETVNLEKLKKIIQTHIKMDIPNHLLVKYLNEKGYKKIDFTKSEDLIETKNQFKKKQEKLKIPIEELNDDLSDDFDFDPNEFLKTNKVKIQELVIPTYTYEDNTSIIRKYQQTKKDELLFEIVKKNMGLVEKIANRYVNKMRHKLDYEDLVSVGRFGLMKAVERFDYKLGNQFSTYATYWIRQSISRAIVDEGTTIRVPVHAYEKITKLIKTENESIWKFNVVDVNWVCEQMEITREKYYELKKVDQSILGIGSLHSIISSEGDESHLIDFVEYNPINLLGAEIEQYKDPYQLFLYKNLQEKLNEVLDTLTEREREVIKLRFGFDTGKIRTLEEVGKVFGVTRERIRQIEAKTIKKLRSRLRYKKIKYDDLIVDL